MAKPLDEQEQFKALLDIETRAEAHAKKGLEYLKAGKPAKARAELKKGEALREQAKKYHRKREWP